jgi:cytochrome c5
MFSRNLLVPVLMSSLLIACGKSEPPPVIPATSAAPAAPTATNSAPVSAPAPAQTPTPAPAAPAPAVAAPAPVAATPTTAALAVDGAAIYKKSCSLCHAGGVAGAPKFGDKAQWTERIAQGNEVLYTHAIKGFKGKTGVMPAKGGSASLTDDQVKAAVDHMVAAAK